MESLFAGNGSSVYNIGNSKGYPVREVIEVAARVSGRSISIVEAGRRSGDPAVLVADSDKIRRELGRQLRYEELETIIETAWRWYQRGRG
jgi:UDP-glucose 4-epimerase